MSIIVVNPISCGRVHRQNGSMPRYVLRITVRAGRSPQGQQSATFLAYSAESDQLDLARTCQCVHGVPLRFGVS
jgi:hypothetical protein